MERGTKVSTLGARHPAVVSRLADPLTRTSVFTMLTTVVTAGLGYLYWVVATKAVSPSTIGYASSAMALITGCALATHLGTASYLVQRLAAIENTPRWRHVIAAATWPTVLGAGVVATVVQAVSVVVNEDGVHRVGMVIAAAAAAMGITFCAMLEAVFLSMRRAHFGTWLGVCVGVSKLVSLAAVVVVGRNEFALTFGWALSLVGSAAFAAFGLFARLGEGQVPLRGHGAVPRADLLHVLGHHLTSLAGLMVPYLLPSLVLWRLGAEKGGFFYTTWMMGSLFFMISPAVANALFAEGVRSGAWLGEVTLRALRLLVALLPLPVLAGIFGGHTLLTLFGTQYASNGEVLLAILAVAALPDAVSNIGVGILRAQGRLAVAAALNGVIAVVALLGAWVAMPGLGLPGVGIAWLAAQVVGACAVSPLVIRVCLRSRNLPAEPAT